MDKYTREGKDLRKIKRSTIMSPAEGVSKTVKLKVLTNIGVALYYMNRTVKV